MSTENLKKVNPRQDFSEMERELLSMWYEKGILDEYLCKNDNSEKNFSFIDGPITANSGMGIHHAWGRTYKDCIQRYKNMKGFEQRFQNGFDCQGLWVEVEVEKAMGFNCKKDIMDYGLGKFTDSCKARVNKYSDMQTDQSKRLGMFMDWENSYYTMSETNNLYIWHFLKVANEKGLLYKGKSATAWCPRCETGLSQHEQSDGYKNVEDESIYIKAEILGRENEFILVWTTTPWTLSSNVLIALNPNLNYVKAKENGESIYIVEEAAKRLGLVDYEKVEVLDLVGLKYKPFYDEIPAQKEIHSKDLAHIVVEWDLVEANSGSGFVHIAPGCGQEDYELGLELGAPQIAPLDTTGSFEKGFGELEGMYAHDVGGIVIEHFKKKGTLFKTEKYTHSYPHCWRCKTKCLFRLEDNWYLNLESLKPELKDQVSKVGFTPAFAEKRMQDWLHNMGPWMISRKRFYGLSLPFYECEGCGGLHVVGSKEELKKLAVEPEKVDKLPSLHRPWIDEILIRCPGCEKEISRISDVGDCWLDAGVVPFSTLKYLDDKEYWKKWFPADFITEMIEQVRLWFYSMTVFGIVLEGKIPFKSALTFAEMRDENNDRMSKTKPNYVEFNQAADKVGSDSIRWNFVTASLGANMRFGWSTLEDVRRRFYLPLWNSYSYFVTYAKMHGWKFEDYDAGNVNHVMDAWVLSRIKKLSVSVDKHMEEFNIASSSRELEDFVQELSTWYIRRSRERFRKGDPNALGTLHYVLVTLSKLLAPYTPFIADEIYQNLVVNLNIKDSKKSVHLEDYPDEKDFDEKLLQEMGVVRDLCSIGLKIRVENKLKLRQPLNKVFGNIKNEELLNILKEELNVKEVFFANDEKDLKEGGFVSKKEGNNFVALDVTLTDDLREEGLYNDLVRMIQNMRKEKGCKVGEVVRIRFFTESKILLGLIEKYKKTILEDYVVEVVFAQEIKTSGKQKIGDEEIALTIEDEL